MKAIDMTPIIKKYPGYFVALSYDRKKVLGKGHTPEEALKEAEEKGFKDLILTKIPEENRSYLL
jgi:predicted RNase H-like HicB family nuclease